MDFAPHGEQEQIRSSAEAFLADHFPRARLHRGSAAGLTRSERREVADLGWFGLGIPEHLGGVGFGRAEEMLLFREFGRALGPPSVLLTNLAAKTAAFSGAAQVAAKFMSGERAVALAIPVDEGAKVVRTGVTGEFRFFETTDADCALWVTSDGARVVDLAGVNLEPRDGFDKGVPMAVARLNHAKMLSEHSGKDVGQAARLGVAAMLVGQAEAMRDMITEYAKLRQTFGRPIGSYQAVRHPISDMAVRCEAARAQLFMAAMALDEGRADAQLQLDAAKLVANAAAVKNADWNIQLHGGIGVTDEHDAHLFLKRTHLLSRWFGGDRALLSAIVETPLAV